MNYKVSVVIPIFNQKGCLKKCISSLQKQTFPFRDMEVLLIDDGSSDGSAAASRALERKYKNVRYFYQENRGVSAARNSGIRHASGKYIFFLDADDALSKDCIKKVSDFFDTVCDETDLVTYKIETIYEGRSIGTHFRYDYMPGSGVYDLRENAYIGQTTINIAVKNRFEDNILFDEGQTFLEDQKYCCDILRHTLKMGYCSEGKYLYYRDDSSSSGKMSGSCFVFEQSMSFFEELFAPYEDVPLAFQGLYVYDLYWKHASNMLWPYHYNKENYAHALGRIKALLALCDAKVIIKHPNMDFYEKFFFLRLKNPNALKAGVTNFWYELKAGEKTLIRETGMETVITKLKITGDELEIYGYLKSAFFMFYENEPVLCALENDGYLTKKLCLYDSTYNYYLSREKTQRFKAFYYAADLNVLKNVRFETGFGGHWFCSHFNFTLHTPLSYNHNRYSTAYRGYKISADSSSGLLSFSPLPCHARNEIWLYYDCSGVDYDNGYLQFSHDSGKNDGTERYYVVTDKRQEQYICQKEKAVKFGSSQHKALLEKCTKVLTAYIEETNILPYDYEEIDKISDKFQFETVYLQHGVLHIIMPWKYSPERIMADRIVVSTAEEKDLYIRNGFKEKDLIETGMARFEFLSRNAEKKKKILYAPSWRGYLAGDYKNRRRNMPDKKLLESDYFKGIQGLIENERLGEILSAGGWQMDVKLHPIFEGCADSLNINSPDIRTVTGHVNEEEYGLFITDFSSFAYDFLYMNTPVVHYIPDIEEFRCGMNDYRDLNYPDKFWQRCTYTPEEAVNKIDCFINGDASEDSFTDECTFLPFKHPAQELYKRLT